MTNRELMIKAMPLNTLSNAQWKIITKHIEEIERTGNKELLSALETLNTNQARIEVMSNYNDYYSDVMEEPVRAESVSIR